ncbi:MAG: hypothetical protein ACP5FL_08955, partial [Thermoplasmatota archaeon]
MKKLTVLVALASASWLLLPAYGIIGEHAPVSKGTEMDVSGGITPLPSRSVSFPFATQMHRKPIELTPPQIPMNIPVATSELEELEPALAAGETNSLFGAYTSKASLFEQDIAFVHSNTEGATWDSVGSYTLEGIQNFPALDYWRDGTSFVGTFTPDPSDYEGSAQYLLKVTDPADPATWELVYWDWTSYQQRDRESSDIAGYDDVGDATWWYGVTVTTGGSDYEGETTEHIPVFNFPSYTDENSGWGWWWPGYENCAHACVDIDRSNGVMYAAWDQFNSSTPEKGRDILLAIADVHDWWEENWVVNWFYLGGTEDTVRPDVAAKNGHVYIVMEADITIPGKQDVICYYSHDGGTTWDVSTVAANPTDDEMHPQIIAY